MTIMQRAAAIAAMTFSLAGLISHSSPVKASDIDRTSIPAPASTVQIINTVSPVSVPVPAASATPQAAAMVEPIPTEQQAEDDHYNSLAEAVAAQDGEQVDATQRCLAGAIYFEAKGEPLAGQLAVAEVILNRAKSGRYPPDVCSVITQRGQFSFVRGGKIPEIDTDRRSYRTAVAVARVALNDMWDSNASDAMFFNATHRRPSGGAIKVASIGNHVFYR